MQYAESFRDLVVYQKARAGARRLFELSKKFPKEELIVAFVRNVRSTLRPSKPITDNR
jgi:hypothetical protein